MRVRTMAAFAAGVAVAAAGTAMAATKVAAIVGPDNRIHGCYLTSAGLLRVVPSGTACRASESPIAWSATGSGERGPAGPVGAQGPAGPKGDPGVRWRGAWVSGTNYGPGDLVRRGDSVWIVRSGFACLKSNASCADTVPPPTNPIWARFAQDGIQGQGPRGEKGERGEPGPQGPLGPPGGQRIHGWEHVQADVVWPSSSYRGGYVYCSPGKVPLTGGYRGLPALVDFHGEGPHGGPGFPQSGWNVVLQNRSKTEAKTVTLWVICAAVA